MDLESEHTKRNIYYIAEEKVLGIYIIKNFVIKKSLIEIPKPLHIF